MTIAVLNIQISEVENKFFFVSGLVKKKDFEIKIKENFFNTKISAVENKIPIVSGLVKQTDFDAKIKNIEGNYFTTADYNKFNSDMQR